MKSCKYCGRPVRWATWADSGKRIPLEAEPDPRGNLELIPHGGGDKVKRADLFTADHRRYKPHFASCPEADRARREARR